MPKVKVKFTNLKKYSQRVNRVIAEAVDRSGVIKDVTEEYQKMRRKGINPRTGSPYKRLSLKTIEHRRYLERNNRTHPDYSPSKSNLTITGQLIDAIKGKFIKSKSTLQLFISGSRKPYRKNDGSPIKGQARTNKEVAEHLASQGRDVMFLTKKEGRRIIDIIQKKLRKFLK